MIDADKKPDQQTPPQPPKADPPKPPQVNDLPDEALRQRLERERAKGGDEAVAAKLREWGVTSESDVKAAIEAAAKAREAAKTSEDKLAELRLQQEQSAKKTSQYETIIKARLTAELSDLTDQQLEAVKAIAGDDPAEQLKAITALRPTWAKAPADKPADKPPEKPKGDDTAPPRGAAPDATNDSPPNHKAVWEDMKSKNPFAAASYLRQHRAEIFPSQ